MKTGTKSLLFGVHQFIWHPYTVWRGWRALYKKNPSFWECVAIFVHDWGYWGCDKMDDEKGEMHPLVGAAVIRWLYLKTHKSDKRSWFNRLLKAQDLHDFTLFHSRYLAAKYNAKPSDLCWADKMSPVFDPPWFYLFRARLTGELKEYRANAWDKNFQTDRDWYVWLRERCELDARNRRIASHRRNFTAAYRSYPDMPLPIIFKREKHETDQTICS